jgi:hypothetical protein
MILEFFAVADLLNRWEINWVPWYKTSVLISIGVIMIAECAQDSVLLSVSHAVYRWFQSIRQWLPAIHASPPITSPWRIPPLIGQRSPDLPPLYACLGGNERFLLCSLWEYPFAEGCLLASGEATAKFGSGLGFVKILFREGSSLVGGVRAARGRKQLGRSTVAIRIIFDCTYNRVYVNGHLH